MKITIIGAGIGGLAAALGFIATGHEVQVFEKSEKLRSGGNGMIVWPNGTGILTDLGIHPEELGMRMDVGEQLSATGALLIRTDWTELAKFCGTPTVLLGRGRVVEALAERLPEGVLRLGARCVGVEDLSQGGIGSAVASFADGSQVESDVIIGADGYGSVVRRALHGNEPARFTGWAAWHGATKVPIELTSRNMVQAFSGPAGVVALHPLGQGILFWAFETPWKDGDRVPPIGKEKGQAATQNGNASVVGNLRARFGSWADPVPAVLDSITDDDVSVFPFVRHRVPRNWGQGRITLLGDAAHVVPPRTAQGVNQALEDAWVLARVLAEPGDPAAQLREYCAIRQSRMRAVRVMGRLMHNKIGILLLGALVLIGKQDSVKAQQRNVRLFSNYLSTPAQERRLVGD